MLAPWSINLELENPFAISGHIIDPAQHVSHLAASSEEALGYLNKFCALHRLQGQSSAALAAAIVLPSVQGCSSIKLPAPNFSSTRELWFPAAEATLTAEILSIQDVDRLLTLSCHEEGVWSLLLGVFFDAGVECNTCGPWIQGALDALKPLLKTCPWVVARMLMVRQPKSALLWLGVFVLGIQDDVLNRA